MRTLAATAIAVLALAAGPVAGQNLLVNGGFDRDLSGWTLTTAVYPTNSPGAVEASAGWDPKDAFGRANSGGVRFHQLGGPRSTTKAVLSQCVAVTAGVRYTATMLLLVDSQQQYSVGVLPWYFAQEGCAGDAFPPIVEASYGGIPSPPFERVSSNGRWVLQAEVTVAPNNARSVRVDLGFDVATGSFYSSSSFDGVADEVSFVAGAPDSFAWILPTSARSGGVGGSFWTTDLTLANPSDTDALVVVKLLGNSVDGRSGEERTLLVPAGRINHIRDVLGTLFARVSDFGAIRVTSTSPALVVLSETSTPLAGSGGTAGESLPASAPSDLVGSARKTLVPIRENAAFRTNLMLANATEGPLAVDVELFGDNGASLGWTRVDLPPLGMTQLNRVVNLLGVSTLDAGRLSVSTDTPGGLFAAYASVIDNVSNDPRALTPR